MSTEKPVVSLDLGGLEASETAQVVVLHPRTGQETGMVVTVAGADSAHFARFDREATDRRIKLAQNGLGKLDAEAAEREALELVVHCTLGWTGVAMNGEPLAYSPEAARKLYADARFRWLRNQVDRAIADRRNFIKG